MCLGVPVLLEPLPIDGFAHFHDPEAECTRDPFALSLASHQVQEGVECCALMRGEHS